MTANPKQALVGLVMGSRSDWETMQHAAQKLEALGVPFEVRVVSAHRTPDVLFDYAAAAQSRGLRAIIAGAGGAAHRSEEHTSELQSLMRTSYAVFCLKKKQGRTRKQH